MTESTKYPFAHSLFLLVYPSAQIVPEKQLELLKTETSDECREVTAKERQEVKASADFLRRMIEAGKIDLSKLDDIDKLDQLASLH